jgi:hypothetical protein
MKPGPSLHWGVRRTFASLEDYVGRVVLYEPTSVTLGPGGPYSFHGERENSGWSEKSPRNSRVWCKG